MDGRVEYKYLVPNRLLEPLRAELRPFMLRDPFGEGAGLSEYTVRSVYYDTPRFDCYLEKLDGLEKRQKYRIRGYNRPNDRSIAFLEIKVKRGDMIGKHRAPLLFSQVEEFLSAPDVQRDIIVSRQFSRAHDSARTFLYHYYRHCLRPAVLVVYDREAFFGRFDPTLRLTFDKQVRGALSPTLADLYDDQSVMLAIPHHFVFEIKFFRGALPAWISRLVEQYDLQRMAVSKYAICLDAAQARRRSYKVRRGNLLDLLTA